MTKDRAVRRIFLIMQYEPSWFAEVMSASGLFLWGLFSFLTDDYNVSGYACILPAICIPFGFFRALLLFNLKAEWRVFAAIAAAIIGVIILSGSHDRSGILPGQGFIVCTIFGDMLTVGKFSVIAWLRDRE